MRSSFVRLSIAAALLAGATGSAGAAPRYSGYVTPVEVDGMVFPVARSGWYSVINFADDWHAPRMRKIGGRWELVGVHEGNDIFAEPGTPIVAVLGGRVENLGWTFYSGWRVGVRGDDGRYWFYAHMRRFAPGLAIGDRVEPGTLLGEVGNTGYGAVPGHDGEFTYHLHVGIQEVDGSWSNPYPLMRRLYRAAAQP
jgi:murein DD-endopeptidase MepM/ murein hydrolase activator NlpD